MDSQERFENMVGLVEAHQYEWAIWQAALRAQESAGVPSDEEILEFFNIPGLNIEASLEPRELELFLIGARTLAANKEPQP